MASKKNKQTPIQWFITTCVNGNEDTVIKNLKAKVQAMHFEDYIVDAKVIKRRELIEDIFDDNNPQKLPPKTMRNTANIYWKTLGDGKYLKVKIIDRNKFPGYIYVKMIMNDDTWFAVRNAQNISGLVGSSGKGAKPIPITFDEEMLLSGECLDPEYRAIVTSNAIIEMPRDKFDEHGHLIGFFNEKSNKQQKIQTITDVSDIVIDEPKNNEEKKQSINFENIDITNNSKLIPEEEVLSTIPIDTELPNFKVGHTVTILFGEYANIDGQIIALDQENNLADIVFDFMGKETTIKLPLNQFKLKE